MLLLNDIHIGVQRKAGTTPKSQEALRTYLFQSFRNLLAKSEEQELCILGDLFDEFEVSPRDWIDTYIILSDWIARGRRLTLVAGNHDHSPKALRVSSFETLCRVLEQHYSVTIIGIDGFALIGEEKAWALAHCSNQDIFNNKLGDLLLQVNSGDRVLLHCNFDNNFAAQSDHSLNLSREQATAFINKGATLVFAHEHQAKVAMGGSVVVLGNQWPTSISDCLGNDEKFAHVLSGGITKIQTWGREGEVGFAECDWRCLSEPMVDGLGFIRVTGEATSSEAGAVVNAISRFRSSSDAFVISNAVKIDGIVQSEELPASFEATKKFDVIAYIKKELDAEQFAVVETLMPEAA